MKKLKTTFLLTFFAVSLSINAQTDIKMSENLRTVISKSLKEKIIISLNNFLESIEKGNIDESLIDKDNFEFNNSFFSYFKEIENKDTVKNYFQGEIINMYPVLPSQYLITIAYVHNNETGRIFTIIAKENDENIVFASPIKYNTRHWKTTTIETIKFYYPDTINISQAKAFNHKNIIMASKLKLPVRNWDMYMCSNYQEALQLQGCLYDFKSYGIVNSGDITNPKTLFSVMNNEDFSHDVFHSYAENINIGGERNWSAEEGIAYTWGNAYYTDSKGNVPEQQELIPVLQQYMRTHSEIKFLDLFDKSPNVLAEYGYGHPISVKSIISGIICDEIEKQKGADGIIELLKCGKGDENFFKSTDQLIGINRNNFEDKIYELLMNNQEK
jgi:hypothetical protein